MRSKELTSGSLRTVVLIFDQGDEVVSELSRFAQEAGLTAASFRGIGAFSDVVLGYFDWEQKEYRRIPLDEQVEVTGLLGDIAVEGVTPKVHAHVVVGRSDGTAAAGHLLEAHVRPTLEMVLEETPAELRKRHDPETGLALIDVDA